MTTQQPGSSPRRRWLSFSLRGMFLVVTIACIWLAVVATRARKQKQAVDRIHELKGIVFFDYERDSRGNWVSNGQPAAPEWLRKAIGDDYFRRVVTVDFNFGGGNKVSDADLSLFRGLPHVTTLELNNNPGVTDAGLAHLAGLRKLRVLYLYRSRVKGPGIQHLPRNIEFLILTRTPLGDEGLVRMNDLAKLRGLHLGFTNITDEGLANLAGHSVLEDLELRNTSVSDAGLEHLRSLTSLKRLGLDQTKVTSGGIARLQQALPKCVISPDPQWLDAKPLAVELWPDDYKPSTSEIVAKIQQLDGDADVEIDTARPDQPIVSFRLFDSRISDATLIRLLAEMPELEELNLRRVLVGDRVAQGLPRLKKLRVLYLDESRITDTGLAYVGHMTTLEELSLRATRISDAGMLHLEGLKNLNWLGAEDCGVSNEAIDRLKKALPKCQFSR